MHALSLSSFYEESHFLYENGGGDLLTKKTGVHGLLTDPEILIGLTVSTSFNFLVVTEL